MMDAQLKELLYKSLLAQALGDAFGYIIEFVDIRSIQKRYGVEGLKYEPQNLKLIASDDTQMSLFLLEALQDEHAVATKTGTPMTDPSKTIYKSFIAWLKTQGLGYNIEMTSFLLNFDELYARQAPGSTCLSALGSGKMGTIDARLNDSKGCGSIMRTLPIAFFANSLEQAFLWGAKQGAITHGHPAGYLSAGLYSGVVYELIHNTRDLIQATNSASKCLAQYKESDSMKEVVRLTLNAIKQNPDLQGEDMTDLLGQGWVADEAFSVGLYCAATSSNFAQVLEKSANHSGDSDSTAMLAAGLWYLATRDDSFLHDAMKVDLFDCIAQLVNRKYV